MDKQKDAFKTRLDGIKKASTGTKICYALFSSIFALISMALPIAMIVVGAQHKDECTIQRFIPIWMIVTGATSILILLLSLISLIITTFTERNLFAGIGTCFSSIISLFAFAWFIAGNVWVFSASKSVVYDNITSANYCQKDLYLFAFWIIIVSYIIMGVAMVLCCFFCCCAIGMTAIVGLFKK